MQTTKTGVTGPKTFTVMKKILFTLACGLTLIACQKAVIDKPSNDTPAKGAAVTLTAILPDFNAESKADIANNGTFSWTDGTNADVIAVRYVKDGEPDEFVEFTCTDAAAGTFTGNPTDGFTLASSGDIAYYPADYRGTPSAQSFASPEAAAKGFQMKATSLSEGKLSFQHDNALLIVNVNNVPSFATTLVVGSTNVTLSAGGNLTVKVPSVAADAAPLTISVKKDDVVLMTKSTTKSVAIQKGYLYTHIPTLTVAPEAAYLKSSMTNWDEDTVAPMALDGSNYTLTLNSIGNQFATVYVKWASGYIKMGPETDQSTTESQVLIPTSHAVKLSTLGTYKFTFNPLTNEFSFEKTSDKFTFYVFGTENEWSLTDTTMPLINQTSDGKYYLIGQKGEYKIRYNNFEQSSFGYGSANSGSSGVNVFGPNASGSSSVIINVPNDGSGVTYNYFNENYQSAESHSAVYVKINNSNDGLPMVQDAYNKSLWTYTYTSAETHYVTFWVDALWDTGDSLASTEYNGVGATYNNYYSVGNWCIGAMTYLIVLNDNTGKIKFLRMPSTNSGNTPDYSLYDMGSWDDYDI